MDSLKGTIREPNAKAKQQRKKGIIPGVLYGKSLDESISLQFSLKDVEYFLRRNAVGYKVNVEIDGEKHLALVKETTYTPAVNTIEHLSFQALTKGERVSSTAQIVLLNEEKIIETVQQTLFEVAYRGTVEDLFTRVEVDLEGMEIGDSVLVSELNIPNKERIEILNQEDTMVVSIVEKKTLSDELDAEAEAAEAAEGVDAADVPTVGEETEEE